MRPDGRGRGGSSVWKEYLLVPPFPGFNIMPDVKTTPSRAQFNPLISTPAPLSYKKNRNVCGASVNNKTDSKNMGEVGLVVVLFPPALFSSPAPPPSMVMDRGDIFNSDN